MFLMSRGKGAWNALLSHISKSHITEIFEIMTPVPQDSTKLRDMKPAENWKPRQPHVKKKEEKRRKITRRKKYELR